MSKRLFLAFAALVLILAIFNPSAQVRAQVNPAPSVNTNATFQVVVGAVLATNVDVWLDGVVTAEKNVKSLNASGFIIIPSGSHTISLFEAGSTTVAVGAPFIFTFPPGPNSDTSVILLPDMTWTTMADVGVKPAPSMATARVINLSRNNTPVDVTVDGAAPATFTGVAYNTASPTYISFPVGSHTVTIPGTAITFTKNFIAGDVYSIFVFENGMTSKLLVSAEFSFQKVVAYLPIAVK